MSNIVLQDFKTGIAMDCDEKVKGLGSKSQFQEVGQQDGRTQDADD